MTLPADKAAEHARGMAKAMAREAEAYALLNGLHDDDSLGVFRDAIRIMLAGANKRVPWFGWRIFSELQKAYRETAEHRHG